MPLLTDLINAQSCGTCAAPLDMTLVAAFSPPAALWTPPGAPSPNNYLPVSPVEPCDVVTFHFGDGTPDVTLTGVATTTHHYASPGVVTPSVTISNTLGTRTASSSFILTATPAAVVKFSQPIFNVMENAGSITIPVQRTGNLSVTSTVFWSTPCVDACTGMLIPDPRLQNGSGTLVFAPGETSKTITLALYDDNVYSGDAARFVYIRAYDGTFLGGTYTGQQPPASDASCQIHIIDDDPQPVATIDDVSVPEHAGKARFTVRLSAPIAADTTYDWYTQDGTAIQGIDYAEGGNGVLIPAGATSGSFDVPIFDHNQPEPDKTFTVHLSAGSTVCASIGRSIATCTIRDDDFFVPSSLHLTTGDHASLTFDAATPLATDTTIPLTSSNPSVVAVPAAIHLAAGTAKGTVDVNALAAGTASVNVTVRGVAGFARIVVSDPEAIVATPPALTLRGGQHAAVTLSIVPASTTANVLSISSSDDTLLQVPASATIQPGGIAEISVQASGTGSGTIFLTDPVTGVMSSVAVDVVSANAPIIDAVVPSVGPASGGTRVTLLGSHLDAPCAVSFGTVAGTSIDPAGSTLEVTTPAHAAGTVDLVVTCGNDQVTLPSAFTFGHSRQRTVR